MDTTQGGDPGCLSQVQESSLEQAIVGKETAPLEVIAWAAGFFDGEGSVSIALSTRRKAYHWLCIAVVNTDLMPILKFQTCFGGHVRIQKPSQKGRSHWRDVYLWEASGQKAVGCLAQLLPYLASKRQQAELAIEFQRSMAPKRRSASEPPLTPEKIYAREALRQKVCKLNSARWTPVKPLPLLVDIT